MRWNRFAVLALLAASACAQGVQDNAPVEADTDLGGGDTGGASAGHGGTAISTFAGNYNLGGSSSSTAGTTGSAGTVSAGGTVSSIGGGGAGGKSASAGSGGASASGGKGGSASGGSPSGGSVNGGAPSGGAPSGGAPSGGSGGSVVSSGGSGGAVTTNGISIQYKVVNTNASSAYIECEFHVVNAGPNTWAVSELKARYYYTDEVKVTPQWNLNWSHVSTGGADQSLTVTDTVNALTPAATQADSYLEFSFSSSAQATIAPGQGLDFSWRFNGPDQAKDIYTQTNDYSFDATKTAQADWTHVVLFHNGTVIWGQTP